MVVPCPCEVSARFSGNSLNRRTPSVYYPFNAETSMDFYVLFSLQTWIAFAVLGTKPLWCCTKHRLVCTSLLILFSFMLWKATVAEKKMESIVVILPWTSGSRCLEEEFVMIFLHNWSRIHGLTRYLVYTFGDCCSCRNFCKYNKIG